MTKKQIDDTVCEAVKIKATILEMDAGMFNDPLVRAVILLTQWHYAEDVDTDAAMQFARRLLHLMQEAGLTVQLTKERT